MGLISSAKSLVLAYPFRMNAERFARKLARWQQGAYSREEASRFQYAMLVSIFVHAVVVFGVTIRPPDASRFNTLAPRLEVVLVNAKSPSKPVNAPVLAQHNLDGGGSTDADRRAKSPLPAKREERRPTELTMEAQRVQQLEREAQRLMTQAQAEIKAAPASAQPQQQEPQTQVAPNTANILNRSLEIARLEAQISKDWDDYQKRPRRKFVGARTQEYRFARYVEDWRLKVERVGTLNYPEGARNQRIYGSLQLTVSIKADGKVDNVEINRSSGQKILDEAALRIVQLAAPYAAFPTDIARDTDILSITRTWTFTRSDQLSME
jgi:periplasmic protein TonB